MKNRISLSYIHTKQMNFIYKLQFQISIVEKKYASHVAVVPCRNCCSLDSWVMSSIFSYISRLATAVHSNNPLYILYHVAESFNEFVYLFDWYVMQKKKDMDTKNVTARVES